MSEPLVSVIMPAYNAGKFIDESIRSVIAQSFAGWELIVVDDGSVDNTKQIVEQFCNTDSRIKYFYQPNGKQGKARNKGIVQSRGKYIAFLDADDVWLPQKLEVQLKEIEEKNVDLVFADIFAFENSISEPIQYKNSGKGFFKGEEGLHQLLERNKIPCSTVLVKKDAIQNAGSFTENIAIPYAEDYHLWIKMLLKGYSFFGIDCEMAGYRMHPSSSSHDDRFLITYVIEVFQDIKKNFKPYKTLIISYQKKWFGKYYYSTNAWDQNDFNNLVSKNCSYLNKSYLTGIFKTVNFFSGINFTRKLINITVNGYNNRKLYTQVKN